LGDTDLTMGDFGLHVDFEAERVRFPTLLVERFIVEALKHYQNPSKG
jgi:hypothetical protein